MVVDSVISVAKRGRTQVCGRVVELFCQNIPCQPLKRFFGVKVTRLYLGKATLDSGKLDPGLVSAGSNGFERKGGSLKIRR